MEFYYTVLIYLLITLIYCLNNENLVYVDGINLDLSCSDMYW